MIPSRKQLENKFTPNERQEALMYSTSIDLENNHKIIDKGNGFIEIKPIDSSKLISHKYLREYSNILNELELILNVPKHKLISKVKELINDRK